MGTLEEEVIGKWLECTELCSIDRHLVDNLDRKGLSCVGGLTGDEHCEKCDHSFLF